MSDHPRKMDPPRVRVANALRDEIRSKKLLPGEQLPTLSQLCERFGVSRNTMVAAIQILKDEGLVIGQRGWGTFVADKPPTG